MFDGELLTTHRELIHLQTRDVLELCDVLGRLTHGDVHVGQTGLWGPGIADLFRTRCGALHGGVEERVHGFSAVASAVAKLRHRLYAGRDEDVTLARANGVRGHADGLK